jgi:FAD/FMN-containing dehydrogenase
MSIKHIVGSQDERLAARLIDCSLASRSWWKIAMNRRQLIQSLLAVPFLRRFFAVNAAKAATVVTSRVRPSDPQWPDDAAWKKLRQVVEGRLVQVQSPLVECREANSSVECEHLFRQLKNPFFLGDEVGLSQTLGWIGAWTSLPSTYAVLAETTEDISAAVNFARERKLRLVVKGGGHSYQGTSNSADALLISTRKMDSINLHDAFVGLGCEGRIAAQPAVTIEAGAMWGHVYHVLSNGGRYVQGGGCLTVGVAGLVLGGGFGSFSKAYGTAAANLLQAEIVTADGVPRVANACSNPDLFWALKGGGGGSFGAVTKLTLRTHDLPDTFHAAFMTIRATSDEAFQQLIDRLILFYAEDLLGPQWGEQIAFGPSNVASISMVGQGLNLGPEAVWRPMLDWLANRPGDFRLESAPIFLSVPARHFWDPAYLSKLPGITHADDRPGASSQNVFWAANLGEAGQVLHAYQSWWLPVSLLQKDETTRLSTALFAASRHWKLSLHFNKGLAGSAAEVIDAARDTATNPAVLNAFALLICGAGGPPAYPGIPGHEPDLSIAAANADRVEKAMDEIRKVVPVSGSYLSESNFFEKDWQTSFWGANYARLLTIKSEYDPQGLFFVHNGVGSEAWTHDGFDKV